MILHRKNGKRLLYHFKRSYGDLVGNLLSDIVCELELFDMKNNVPCLVLLCAEERSLITKIHRKDKFKLMNVVTITEDDNLLSPYGRAKWRRCIRSSCDCAFFAGPCTGGSPWNRLNKNVSEATAHQIGMKAFLYWELWEEFSNCLMKVIEKNAMALLELPRGCDYWRDDRMVSMINGTDSHDHQFDGCMYGLRTQYTNIGSAIKKPWRIMSWGVSFDGLHSKCDGSHTHGQCAGRDTRVTQLYTEEIVKCILKGLKNRMLLNNAHGRSSQSPSLRNSKGRRTVQASPWIMMKNDDHYLSPDLLSNWIAKRCGVKVRFDVSKLRFAVETDPNRPCLSFREAMAEETATVAKGLQIARTTITILRSVVERGQLGQLPVGFRTFAETITTCRDSDMTRWMNHVKIAPIIIVSLTFVMMREAREQVTHVLQLLMKLFTRITLEDFMEHACI